MEKEENKRKREEGRDSFEAINPFAKSKKLERTPKKSEEAQEEGNMEEVKEMLRKMMKDMEEIKKDNKGMRKEMEEIKNDNRGMRKEIEEMRAELHDKEQKWEKEKEEMGKTIRELERRMEERERKDRKNNIVITGVQDINDNMEKNLEDWLEKELGVKAEIEEAIRINAGRMIMVKLRKWEDKRRIMQNKSKLRGNVRKIFIDDDLTKKEREVQKKIREIANEKRGKGEQVRVGFKKIGMNGRWYKWVEEIGGIEWNQNF